MSLYKKLPLDSPKKSLLLTPLPLKGLAIGLQRNRRRLLQIGVVAVTGFILVGATLVLRQTYETNRLARLFEKVTALHQSGRTAIEGEDWEKGSKFFEQASREEGNPLIDLRAPSNHLFTPQGYGKRGGLTRVMNPG